MQQGLARHLASFLLAAGLAMAALSAQALTYTAVFLPVSDDAVELDGFGRGATSGLRSGADFATQAGTREFFRDLWEIDTSQIAPGQYTLAPTVIEALGTLEFFDLSFRSYDALGELHIIDFAVNASRTQAVGSGSFTVLSTCPVRVCVWIEVLGTQLTGVPTEGYGGTVSAVAVVPEPGRMALMLAGLGAVGALVRRRRRAATA